MTRPRPQARREASLPKVKLIRALQDDAIRRRREKVYDATSMAVTARLLEINPEVLTAWNFRREALAFAERAPASPEAGDETSAGHDETQPELTSATIPKSKPPALPPRLVDELELTERCLRKHPKSYAAWHHRKWCVARFANAPRAPSAFSAPSTSSAVASLLAAELAMSQTLLDMDDRNFHGWGYRRFVVALTRARAGAPPRSEEGGAKSDVFAADGEGRKASAMGELRYSEAKIERNFSNYSAWHHRAAYLPRAFAAGEARGEARRDDEASPDRKADESPRAAATPRLDARPRVPDPVLAREYAFVRQAFFTEPEDQAGWMYHRWLTAQTARSRGEDSAAAAAAVAIFAGEADALAELCALEPDCKWPVLTLARLCDLEGTEAGAAESARRLTQLARLDPTRRGFYCDCGGRA